VGRKGERIAIYISTGVIKQKNRLYLFEDSSNAFCSVRESWKSPMTCWCDWHNLLRDSMPVVEIGGEPGWCQVIHDRNVSNRIRGTRVSPSSYVQRFPGLLDDVCAPDARDQALDLLVSRPARFARETSRKATKAVLLRLLGKDGLTLAKLIWSSREVWNWPRA
jgi:hypothetical protein